MENLPKMALPFRARIHNNKLSRYADFNEPFSIESFFKQTKARFKFNQGVSFSHLPFCGNPAGLTCWLVETLSFLRNWWISCWLVNPFRCLHKINWEVQGVVDGGFGGWWRAMLVPRHKPCNIAGWELHYVKMYLLSKTVGFPLLC